MPSVRVVVFVPPAVVSQYDAIADSAAMARSALMRWALENALPQVRDYALTVAAGPVSLPQPGGVPPVPAPRRRGRPPGTENAKRLLHLQQHARGVLDHAPDTDEHTLRGVLVAFGTATLGLPETSPLIDQALRVVLDSPDTRPPTPVAGNRPPRGGGDTEA